MQLKNTQSSEAFNLEASDIEESSCDAEVLLTAEHVHKKFCRSLKRSLWYGMKDVTNELNPFSHDTNSNLHERNWNADAHLRQEEFYAIRDVSFELRRGECLGLIGHNGAGKTTLLKMLNGLIKPDHGKIQVRGRVGALIALGAGFNPILSGRENVYINAAVLGLKKKEIDDKLEEIIDFAEIGEFIDAPVQSYSSGMQVRLGFAVATSLKPDVLILDEVLAVGDAAFRAKCELTLSRLIKNSAVILVSHNPLHISRLCQRVLWLQRGCVVGEGDPGENLRRYASSLDVKKTGDSSALVVNHLENFRLINSELPTQYRDRLKLGVTFRSTKKIEVRIVVIGIHDKRQGQVAQSTIDTNLCINGEATIAFETGEIELRDGDYTVTLAFYGKEISELYLRATNFVEFNLDSGMVSHAAYNFQTSLKLA
ncbi:ABC transporter ATP-binding protein [Allorhodopirellula heiligendammensis]|uniref:Teichoic acids export ATP-binding protein TagH n=1 Tax=Allorhodopirellula heiligendammensis TaxID=2714739 RepID=A0A5C6C3H0_9BACT|nr:ABC transporter ATP-binding protein [Allorhodopirellula heiligendammensis]TWU18066.1 Teichoic acids export ATP-binding protein TagH [Allorhodopirellula heiligendammensis]